MVRVVPLGTSSAIPTKSRGLSALAVSYDGGWVLFDCGEGTQHKVALSPLKLQQLEAVFITHLHGDHVFGLAGLLNTMAMYERRVRLPVFGPAGIRRLLSETFSVTQSHLSFELAVSEIAEGPLYRTSRFSVLCAPLDHTVPSFGYAFVESQRPGKFDCDRARALGVTPGPDFGRLQRGETVVLANGDVVLAREVIGEPRQGARIAYCTDTRPSAGAIILGFGADLLVHEATYSHDLAVLARERGHSTAREAALIAREAKAHRLLLTHFSSRYEVVDNLVDEARKVFPQTEAARDLGILEVKPGLEATPALAA